MSHAPSFLARTVPRISIDLNGPTEPASRYTAEGHDNRVFSFNIVCRTREITYRQRTA
jgi:hypothetical protein